MNNIDLGDLDLKDNDLDLENINLESDNIIKEGYFDNIKDEKDPKIGYDPDEVLKYRQELKINLIYFDDKITKSQVSYDYYKKFKVNVVGGFYASDEIDVFRQYLNEISNLEDVPSYIVVTDPNNLKDIYDICKDYNFVKEIVLIDLENQKKDIPKKIYKKKLKYIADSYEKLCEHLKNIGDSTSNFNKILKFFSSNRIFTKKEIQMDRQLSTCPIITAYEYDKLFFMVHRAYAHFFANDSLRKDPRVEKEPKFEDENFEKIEEFLKIIDLDDVDKKILLGNFRELKNSKNFTVDAIKKYTGENLFCYVLNRVMRNFEKGSIKLVYYVGPLLFGLNRYALQHPNKCLNKDTTLYRKIKVSPLEKYVYNLAVGHIICFSALTSTSVVPNRFKPTDLGKNINKNLNKNKINTEVDTNIEINMIIEYKHYEGNIPPGLDISDISSSKNKNEILIFPFTFLRINKIEPNSNTEDSYIFYMEIINRKKIIEYELKEGTKFNIEKLEALYDEDIENNKINLDEGKISTFHVREEEPNKKDKKKNISSYILDIFQIFK